jgi:hypothetical protein
MLKYFPLFIFFLFSFKQHFSQCTASEKELIINITPDSYPAEITWDVKNLSTATVIASGDSLGSAVCLDTTTCFKFTIYDSFGDGICCSFGNGSYDLIYDGISIQTGGSYGSLESKTINCLPIDSTNLPLVKINTNGQTILDDLRIIADMEIIYNGPNVINHYSDTANNYRNKISIEKRGSSSQTFPKKSYSFETQDVLGNNNNVSLIDLPVENDWVLYAPYSDKSLMRNVLTYRLGREMMDYAPRTQFCEVLLNDEYIGVYVLTEKIKRDNDRIDISKLDADDLAGDSLTGGYIVKIDKTTGGSSIGWASPYTPPNDATEQIDFLFHYPKENDILPAQANYIENYMTTFEEALNGPSFEDPLLGYAPFISDISFIDFFIFNELSKNVDGYRISSYLYKDKDSKGGKLTMGPLWDFNIAYGNSNYCEGELTSGWQKDFNDICQHGNMVPFWWNRLLQDTTFANRLKCRWEDKRSGPLHLDSIFHKIDSFAVYLDQAQARNFTTWNILGTYIWPNNYIGTSYIDEVNFLKSWISLRIDWLDINMPGTCPPQPPLGVEGFNSFPAITLYPNPAKNILYINLPNSSFSPLKIELQDIKGTIVYNEVISNATNKIALPVNGLKNGFYTLKLSSNQLNRVLKFIKSE